jgi:hypothetical protein
MMQASVLERPDTKLDSPGFCHVVCLCTPKLTLCGAYKERVCGATVWDLDDNTKCPVCQKELCADCENLTAQQCIRCGL